MTPSLPNGVRLHWDPVRKTHVLLAPERALMLDDVGHHVLSRVDGHAQLTDICADLARQFDAPIQNITDDVSAFLTNLSERRLVDIHP